MAKLARSSRRFRAPLVHIAIEATSTSEDDTKPASDNAAWLQLGSVQAVREFLLKHTEEWSEGEAAGWRDRKKEHLTGRRFEIDAFETPDLFERLAKGLESAIVEGTAQTPDVVAERMLRGWLKIQARSQDGTDDTIEDYWCEIRVMDPPAMEKSTQMVTLEFWVLTSTLNAFVAVDNS